jgi:hypothetical protein
MTDWKKIATAVAPDIPQEAVDRAVKPLETLEGTFRPLIARIPLETEPAYVLLAAGEEQ